MAPADAILREALFASDLQYSWHPDETEIRAAIDKAIRRLGVGGCRERVAQEFGDHPDLAVTRMRWAKDTVAALGPGAEPAATA